MNNTDSSVFLALDGMSHETAYEKAQILNDHVLGGKANDLIEDGGAGVLHGFGFALKFLDPKLHDVRKTMVNRLKKYVGHADIVTVHAGASFEALRECGAVGMHNGMRVIAITLLTDIGEARARKDFKRTPRAVVEHYTKKAKAAGLAGVVCSPQETRMARDLWSGATIINPGVRSAMEDSTGQVRVGTPYQAIRDGADYLVCGTQIFFDSKKRSRTPQHMILEAQRINEEVDQAKRKRT